MNRPARMHRILHLGIVKIIIALVVCIGITLLVQLGIQKMLGATSISKDGKGIIQGLVISLVVLLVYTRLFRWYEKRKITELSAHQLAKNLLWGLLLGFVLQSLAILVIYLAHGLTLIEPVTLSPYFH